jgi:hypothetical protein
MMNGRLLIAVVLLAVNCSVVPNASVADKPPQSGWARYTARNGLYRIDAPADWGHRVQGTHEWFVASGTQAAAVEIAADDGPELNLNDYAATARSRLPFQITSDRLVEQPRTQVDGQPAAVFVAEGRGQGYWEKYVGFPRKGKNWGIRLYVDSPSPDRFEPTMNAMLASLKFLQ